MILGALADDGGVEGDGARGVGGIVEVEKDDRRAAGVARLVLEMVHDLLEIRRHLLGEGLDVLFAGDRRSVEEKIVASSGDGHEGVPREVVGDVDELRNHLIARRA